MPKCKILSLKDGKTVLGWKLGGVHHWKEGNSTGMTNTIHEKKRIWARQITEVDTIPKGTEIGTKKVWGTCIWPPFMQARTVCTGSGVSNSGCSKKDRTEAILYKCQELSLNGIYSQDTGMIVLDLIFLRMLLNDLEIERDQVIF